MNTPRRPFRFKPAPLSTYLSRGFRCLATPCNEVCNGVLRAARIGFAGLVPASNESPPVQAKAIGAVNEQLGGDDWIRITPFGEFPNQVGRQVVDRVAADEMVSAFNAVSTKLATLFRGLPVYEGHPDDPEWRRKNPAVRPVAVGRVKELQVREDGLWGRIAWNERGAGMVRGDAPAYTAQSPHWGMLPLPPRPKTYRPVELFSLGLTNTPNIPETLLGVNEAPEPVSDMKPQLIALLAALGRPVSNPSAVTDEQLVAAVNEALPVATQLVATANELGTVKTELATVEAKVTAATNEAGTLRTQLQAERTARADLLLTAALNEGRITQAQRAEWHGKLTANGADFAAVQGQLSALKKAVNTQSRVADVGGRKGEGVSSDKITAINEAVGLKKQAGLTHDQAYAAVRKEKPELFTTAGE